MSCSLVLPTFELTVAFRFRGLGTANLLASFKGSDARATVRMAVGDTVDDGRGFSISLNFLHKGNGKAGRVPAATVAAVLVLTDCSESVS